MLERALVTWMHRPKSWHGRAQPSLLGVLAIAFVAGCSEGTVVTRSDGSGLDASNADGAARCSTLAFLDAAPRGEPPRDFLDYGAGLLAMRSSETRTIEGVTLRITTTGDLQVVGSDGALLWHSGTTASCAADACRLTFQSDGNLVLEGPSGPYWSSGTYDGVGRVFVFAHDAPHLSIRDHGFDVVWSSSEGPASANIGWGVRAPSEVSPAVEFLDTLGVNSHSDQSGLGADVIAPMLTYLGVRHLRDGWRSDGSLVPLYTSLASRGIDFDLILGDPYEASALDAALTLAALAPGTLETLEGPNEINNFPFECNGVTSTPGWPNANGPLAYDFMTHAHARVHGTSGLEDVALVDLTWAGTDDAEANGLLDLEGRADLGNLHYYPPGTPLRGLLASFAAGYHHVHPAEGVITESGWATSDVSADAQAILTLELVLDAYLVGFHRLYLYELYDEWQSYGLFDASFAPKPAATALHNLTSILAGARPDVAPRRVPSTWRDLPDDARVLVLALADDTLAWIVWREVTGPSGGVEDAATVRATLELGGIAASLQVFRPLDSADAVVSSECVGAVEVDVGPEPVVIRVTL